MSKKKQEELCPCGSGKTFADCCEPVIEGNRPASSAEALMRSRYTAYVLHDESYLLDSWHISTRPVAIDMDASVQWLRLKIIQSENDMVEFIATYWVNGKAYKLHEKSRFIFENGKWFYLDAIDRTDN